MSREPVNTYSHGTTFIVRMKDGITYGFYHYATNDDDMGYGSLSEAYKALLKTETAYQKTLKG